MKELRWRARVRGDKTSVKRDGGKHMETDRGMTGKSKDRKDERKMDREMRRKVRMEVQEEYKKMKIKRERKG